MTVSRDDLIKQAYAHGAALALEEVGVEKQAALNEAVAFTEAATQGGTDERQKRAYLEGVSIALQEQGLDEKTAEATAEQWVNL